MLYIILILYFAYLLLKKKNPKEKSKQYRGFGKENKVSKEDKTPKKPKFFTKSDGDYIDYEDVE